MAEINGLEVLAWNISDALSDRARGQVVVNDIFSADSHPDVVVFEEAYSEAAGMAPGFSSQIIDAGYNIFRGPYEIDGRKDRHEMLAAVNADLLVPGNYYGLFGAEDGVRSSMSLPVFFLATSEIVEVVGMHGSDREYPHEDGEPMRRLQVARAIQEIGDRRGVIMGDFNAMHGGDLKASVLRQLRPVTDRLPAAVPGEDANSALGRKFSLAQRLVQYANGGMLRVVEDSGFRCADTEHRPTIGPVHIDHIMVKGLTAEFVRRQMPQFNGKDASDHRPISARLMLD